MLVGPLDNLEAQALVETGGAWVWWLNVDLTAEVVDLLFFEELLEMLVELRADLHVLVVVGDHHAVKVHESVVPLVLVEEVVLRGVVGISSEGHIESDHFAIVFDAEGLSSGPEQVFELAGRNFTDGRNMLVIQLAHLRQIFLCNCLDLGFEAG